MSSTCGGECCAVFAVPSEVASDPQSDQQRYIADMVIPLTRRQAFARYRKFVGPGKPSWKTHKDVALYTCRHWDEGSRLCGAYDERPDMCRDYPYGKPCSLSNSCDYRISDEAVAQKYGNGTWKWDAEANGWRPQSSQWGLWDAENGVLRLPPKETPA